VSQGSTAQPALGPGRVLRDRVSIVLVAPQHPGNVGSTARAMKNLGLRRLVVVSPASFDLERARWMASGAHDVLTQARFVGSVDEALVGCTWAVGCTARARKWRWPVLDPDQVATQAFSPSERDGQPPCSAILFGREDMGLDNHSLERCQAILRIPTDGASSINLAQAVLLICSALQKQARGLGWDGDERKLDAPVGPGDPAPVRGPLRPPPAPLENQRQLVEQAVAFLGRTAYMRNKTDPQVAVLLSTLLQRAQPTLAELNILRGMLRKSSWSLAHGAEPVESER